VPAAHPPRHPGCATLPSAPLLAQEAPPPPDVGAYSAKLNDRVPELDAKIAGCDKELLGIKQQMARLKPAQQGPLKARALAVLKRKKMYEGQRDSVQTRAFNLEQTTFALDSVKDAQEHVNVRAPRWPGWH
jgi:charged multivesicular body protein 5